LKHPNGYNLQNDKLKIQYENKQTLSEKYSKRKTEIKISQKGAKDVIKGGMRTFLIPSFKSLLSHL